MPTGSVWMSGSVMMIRAKKNSFQVWIKTNNAAVRIPGAASGKTTLRRTCRRLQPSISAASSISTGTSRKNVVRIQIARGRESAI